MTDAVLFDAAATGDGAAGTAGPANTPTERPVLYPDGVPGRSGDMYAVAALLLAIGADDYEVRSIAIPGPPPSKARPRHTRKGITYSTAADRHAEARTARYLGFRNPEPMTGNVAIACIFYRPNFQRMDADNMLKHVCDAATGVLWVDDSQVTAIAGLVQYDAEKPRTLIAWAHHTSTMVRGTDAVATCEHCGREYQWKGHYRKDRRYCTQRCAQTALAGVDLSEKVTCSQCGEDFRRKTSEQKYCTVECSYIARQGVPKPNKKNPRCPQCGKLMSHNRGGRCRDCWRANPRGIPEPVQTELSVIP